MASVPAVAAPFVALLVRRLRALVGRHALGPARDVAGTLLQAGPAALPPSAWADILAAADGSPAAARLYRALLQLQPARVPRAAPPVRGGRLTRPRRWSRYASLW